MSINKEMQNQLDSWCEKYIRECVYNKHNLFFNSFTELAISDGFRMGYIKCYWDYPSYIQGNIWLDNGHLNCPEYFLKATLWHEFCHFWDACENKHVDHCFSMQFKKLRKPGYALADIVLKFIGWLWFD